MDKLLVLYVFHDYNERVEYFIKHAIFYDEKIDFIIISNSKNNKLNVPKYVDVFFRDNIGYDFGGWSDALLTDNRYKKYNKFIFVNSSVKGPYIASKNTVRWTDLYISGLKDNVKLFGSTINTMRNPLKMAHVQSYIFAMSKSTLKHLILCEIFSKKNYPKTFEEAINTKEILMSRKIIENGWNIGSLMPYYKGVDFTFSDKQPRDYKIPFLDDIMYPQYRNLLWNEYDIVFIKGNRIRI